MLRPPMLKPAFAAAATCAISLMFGLLLAGCGGDDGKSGPSEDVQALRIEQFQADIRFFCITGRNDLDGAADPLGTVITAVDNLIKIYRQDPNATYKLARVDIRGDKLRVRDVAIGKLLTQSAATLDKGCGKYGRDQATRLESAVSS
jgi:hypothetical protein